jgi:hypothetical protein
MPGPELLAALADGGGAAAADLPARLLAEAAATSPKMAMFAKLLETRRAAEAEAGAEAPLGGAAEAALEEISELGARLAEAESRIEAMRRDGRRLYSAHQACRERLGDLAAALGACGLCWGEDGRCPSCRGRGRPGMMRPDLDLRARLLGPRRAAAPAAEAVDTIS